MNKKYALKKAKRRNVPNELIARLMSLYEHCNLREQRDTFTSIIKHRGGAYRWNAHLLLLPHYHLIETESFGEKLTLHVWHAPSGYILTLECTNGNWIRKALTPDDTIRNIVPDRCRRTGWLAKKASRAQINAVSRISGVRKQNLPDITAANANVIIHTDALVKHIHKIESMIRNWIAEISSENPLTENVI